MPRKTVFQRLTDVVIGTGNGTSSAPVNTTPVYNIDPVGNGSEVIASFSSKEERDNKLLQMKQQRLLAYQWGKIGYETATQQLAGANQVRVMYRDADLMDAWPEIGAALDAISEECTVINDKGKMLNIYSDSERVRAILEDLFVNRLDIHVLLPMIFRATAKYGNEFMFLNIDKDNGILGWRELPVHEMVRIENGLNNGYGGSTMYSSAMNLKPDEVKFVWEGHNQESPFMNWQVAHFRLIKDSLYLPYGCLVGDTRIETENGFKEMSNIQIGDKVWTFNIGTQKKELSTVTMFMPKGEKEVYKVSTFHNEIEGTNDHKLLTYNNNKLEYKEIKDLKIGDLLIVDNSFNKCNEKIKIDKSYPTEKEANLNKNMIWWKDYIDYIPDYVDDDFAKFFGFMIGDGWITENKYVYFATGEYEKFNIEFAKYMEKITNHKCRFIKPHNTENNNYEYSSCVNCSKCLSLIMHRMGFIDGFDKKRIPSWVFASNDEIKKAFLNGLMIADGSYNIDKYGILRCGVEMSNEQLIKDIKILVQSLGYKSSKVSSRNRVGKYTKLKNGYNIITKNTSYYFYFYESFNKQEKKYDLVNRLENGFKTEKIRKISYVGKRQTYDFTVSNENSNFFANGIVTHNCSFLNKARRHWRMLSMMEDAMLLYRLERSIERRIFKVNVGLIDDADIPAFLQQFMNNVKRAPIIDPQTGQMDLRKNFLDVSADYVIPIKNGQDPTTIETLQSAQNSTSMEDINYMQNKVLTALRIPKAYLNFQEAQGKGQNLSLLDIRFNRVINNIQQAILMELNKIAIIHLYVLGFRDEITNFTLSLNNPSNQVEMMVLENLNRRIGVASAALSEQGGGIPIMSWHKVQKDIMGLTDSEISNLLNEIRLEAALALELQNTPQIIKKTGLFDKVDRIYGEPGAQYSEQPQGGDEGGFGGGGGPTGGGGGLDFGGGFGDTLGDFGGEMGGGTDLSGSEGSEGLAEMGGGNTGEEAPAPLTESIDELKKNAAKKMFLEAYNYRNSRLNETARGNVNVIDSAFLINEELNSAIKGLEDEITENIDKNDNNNEEE